MSGDIGWLPDEGMKPKLCRLARAFKDLGCNLIKRTHPRPLMTGVREIMYRSALLRADIFPDEIQSGLSLMYVRELLQTVLPPADVTIATESRAALAVSLYGTGRKFYFAQHFEPYFSVDMSNPGLWEYGARQSYRLGLRMIANSSWLQGKLQQEIGSEVALCPNAIDHSVYSGSPKTGALGSEVRVISYGGRHAKWKGFREMAQGIQLARKRLPGLRLRWLVYGPCILEPSNSIAEYEALGFLQPPDLAKAYRDADILLSASWYESFPLFPLEAMACGLPVITTQYGTEEFAFPGKTAEVVQANDPESIAAALIRLITDAERRHSIAADGNELARQFTWQKSVARMESLLFAEDGPAPIRDRTDASQHAVTALSI